MDETIQVTPHASTIGAVVRGVDLARGPRDGQPEALRRAVLDHLVVFLPGQHLDDDGHAALTGLFGELVPHPVDAFLGERKVASSIVPAAYLPGEDHFWHTDYTFLDETPNFAVLRAVEMPARGGDTLWASMYDAYETLSPSMQAFLEDLEAVHDQGPQFGPTIKESYGEEVGRAVIDAFPGATHPVVIVHPETGRKLLYVNEAYTRSIVGLTTGESRALLRFLFDHVNNPRFHCRYHWAVGDVAIWDEKASQHLGEGRYWPESRLMRRIVAGTSTPRAARGEPAVAAV